MSKKEFEEKFGMKTNEGFTWSSVYGDDFRKPTIEDVWQWHKSEMRKVLESLKVGEYTIDEKTSSNWLKGFNGCSKVVNAKIQEALDSLEDY